MSREWEQFKQQRQLLEDPNLIPPIVKNLSDLLRTELNRMKRLWQNEWDAGEAKLTNYENWKQLDIEQQQILRAQEQITADSRLFISVENAASILNTLGKTGLSSIQDRIAALPGRFDRAALTAAQLLEPEIQDVSLPSRTIRTVEQIDQWLQDVEKQLKDKIKKGPIIL